MLAALIRSPWRASGAAVLALFAGLTGAPASAQSPPNPARVITPTRLVWLFQGKESALLEAQAQGKADVVDSLLSEDFMQRSALAPENPLARS